MKKKIVYLTSKQIRSRVDISLSHVYNLLKAEVNPIPHIRLGVSYRIEESKFEEWLKRDNE